MIEAGRCVTSTHSLSRLLAFYETMEAEPLLRVMIRKEFAGKIALLSSFGADSAVLLAMVATVDPATPVLFLETGKHFPETLDYVKRLTHHFGLTRLTMLRPQEKMLAAHDPEGTLWQRQPNRCCWLRKVEPLRRALQEGGYHALITGRRRYQTANRQHMDRIEMGEDQIFRMNPLADWTRDEVDAYMRERQLPQHPLVARGYRSIGCAPCTAPVTDGEDERQGRWAHTQAFPGAQKAECGIHLPESASWEV